MFARGAIAKNPAVADYLFSGFSVFAVMGPALFGVGCILAHRARGRLLKLKRALPAPSGAYLLAKMLDGDGVRAVAMGTLLVTALIVGKITLSAAQIAL